MNLQQQIRELKDETTRLREREQQAGGKSSMRYAEIEEAYRLSGNQDMLDVYLRLENLEERDRQHGETIAHLSDHVQKILERFYS